MKYGFHASLAGVALAATLLAAGCAEKQMEPVAPTEPAAVTQPPAVPAEPAALKEHRAVWVLAPQFQGGPEAMRESLRRLKETNVNVLCVVVQKRGYVIYPGSACLPQLADMNGQDILPAFIAEAHAMGMKVEAWMEYGFYAYHTSDAAANPSRGVWLDAHPELASIDGEGKNVLHNANWGDFYSLDSANPKAQDLLLDLLVETVEKYPFDGINLDRIRYATATHGYSDYCRATFKADTGIDLAAVQQGNDAWRRWLDWRKAQLTAFMERASKRLRDARPGLRITMATVAPGMIDELGQDWPTWLDKGYLDAAYPMLYGDNPTPQIQTVRDLTRGNPHVYAGFDITVGADSFAKAVAAWRAAGYQGVTVWQSAALLDNAEAVRTQIFPDKADSPIY